MKTKMNSLWGLENRPARFHRSLAKYGPPVLRTILRVEVEYGQSLRLVLDEPLPGRTSTYLSVSPANVGDVELVEGFCGECGNESPERKRHYWQCCNALCLGWDIFTSSGSVCPLSDAAPHIQRDDEVGAYECDIAALRAAHRLLSDEEAWTDPLVLEHFAVGAEPGVSPRSNLARAIAQSHKIVEWFVRFAAGELACPHNTNP